MNLQQLRYVLEVEKHNSITRAAKNLFMGQPNLSKIIKELELEFGITIFKRTSKGVAPTQDGKQFLQYARTILSQIDELENLYKTNSDNSLQFNISVPRATYIAATYSKFLNTFIDKQKINEKKLTIHYKETNTTNIIHDVADGESSIGIVHYQKIYEDYFLSLIKDQNLQYEEIWEYSMVLVMSKHHPLAHMKDIPFHLLGDYTEIVHSDFKEPKLSFSHIKKDAKIASPQKRVYIYDRGSQFDFLQNLEGSYLWVSPIPKDELIKRKLVTKKCNIATKSKDILIYKDKKSLNSYEIDFINTLKNTVYKK